MSEQQQIGAVAVDPRRRVWWMVVGGAAAAALVAAAAIAVAPDGVDAATASVDTPTAEAQAPAGSSGSALSPWAGAGQDGSGWYDEAAALAQTPATAATAAQQTGVVTIVSTLGYQGAYSAGTGMILSADGLVLTNHHVVEGATAIEVTDESTGQTYTATVLGTDATADVALLRLEGASGLTPIALDDDGDLGDGDAVTAVGNAEGTGDLVAAAGTVTDLDQQMTASSGTGRETLDGLIEFQADVVSGDSGGPLLDAEGEVVGMTTAASTGGQPTTAYAIDISDALAVVGQIQSGVATDTVTIGYPAFLGVWFSSSLPGWNGGPGSTASGAGATIAGVIDGTPAAAAGLAAGDVVTAVDGAAVSSSDELAAVLATHRPGDEVTITWVSGSTGATSSATVTLAAGPVG